VLEERKQEILQKNLPGTLSSCASTIGSVNEQQIDVIEPSLFQRPFHLSLGVLIGKSASRDLAGEEDL
jgi:hypothetical protein